AGLDEAVEYVLAELAADEADKCPRQLSVPVTEAGMAVGGQFPHLCRPADAARPAGGRHEPIGREADQLLPGGLPAYPRRAAELGSRLRPALLERHQQSLGGGGDEIFKVLV